MRLTSETEIVRRSALGEVDGHGVTAFHVDSRVGESPAWQPSQGLLYWIDVRRQLLRSIEPSTGAVTSWFLPDVVGASALCRSGKVWVALRHTLAVLDVQCGQLEVVSLVEGEPAHNRLNDGKVSPSGRWFLFGSMDDRAVKEPTGRLYRVDASGRVQPMTDGLFVCNGVAFSADASRIYFSDSWAGRVFVAEWDEAAGLMGPARLLCELDESRGRPDGAVVDNDGLYWSAGVSAGRLNVVDALGQCVRSFPLPCKAPTMPAFGGADGQTMFVTTLVREHWSERDSGDGALLAFPSPTQGRHGTLFWD